MDPPSEARAGDTQARYREIVLWGDDPECRMVFRPIPPGEFWMGSRGYNESEEPRHRVRIPAPRGPDGTALEGLPAFWLGETPVTQAQFRRWTKTEACKRWRKDFGGSHNLEGPHENHFEGNPRHPAERVSWWEARAFCEWLNKEEAKALSLRSRKGQEASWRAWAGLPSEAWWEYACRAGTGTEYANGDGEGALREIGWFEENSGERTHPCGELQANAFGLYEMHGNVWEWCLDALDWEAYRKVVDGRIADDRAARERVSLEDNWMFRVMRGGSWYGNAGRCRSAYRSRRDPGHRLVIQGFRVCLLPGPVGGPVSRGARGQARAEAEGGAGRRGGKPSRQAPPDAGAQAAPDPFEDANLQPIPKSAPDSKR